jgi:hypothetical protein
MPNPNWLRRSIASTLQALALASCTTEPPSPVDVATGACPSGYLRGVDDGGDLVCGDTVDGMRAGALVGDLSLQGSLAATGVVRSLGGFCIGTSCIGEWPGGTAGGTQPWVVDGMDISYQAGRVGIGTAMPGSTLEIDDHDTDQATSGVTFTNFKCAGTDKLTVDGTGELVCAPDQAGTGTGNVVDSLFDTLGAGNNGQGRGMVNLGSVGIGTTTPGTALDVVGVAHATDFQCADCLGPGDIGDGLGLSEIDEAQVQQRITGTCAPGASVRAVNQDGTVTCQTDANTSYAAGPGLNLAGTTFSADLAAAGGDAGAATTVARGDHVHDGRYYTRSQLSNSGGGGTVHWNNIASKPAGIADGVDNNTTYTFSCTRKSSTCTSCQTWSVTADAGWSLAGGGCSNSGTPPDIRESYPSSATTWYCKYNQTATTMTAWVVQCRITAQ